jgi:hypothetical protein
MGLRKVPGANRPPLWGFLFLLLLLCTPRIMPATRSQSLAKTAHLLVVLLMCEVVLTLPVLRIANLTTIVTVAIYGAAVNDMLPMYVLCTLWYIARRELSIPTPVPLWWIML